jgi:signal transduction histidine kinase
MARIDLFLSLIERNRHWLLLAQLGVLHLVLVQDIASPIARTMLVVHIGLFLLWQPLVRAHTRVGWGGMLLTGTMVAAAALGASVWLLIGWVMLLAAIIGGKVFFSDSQVSRVFYLLALGYLVCALLIILTPRIIPRAVEVPEAIGVLTQMGLPLILGLMALLPLRGKVTDYGEVIDVVYSAFVLLLLAVLVLGALAVMFLTERGYVEALAITLVAISLFLFFLGWAWNPRAGFSGLGMILSRHFLSMGLPFEDWLHDLTDLSAREPDALIFLGQACSGLMRFPGLLGGEWLVDGGSGRFGATGGRSYEFHHGGLVLQLFARRNLGPALVWHFQLLTRILDEFQVAKSRAQQLQQLSYLQAVHETGARLTHDVKNLLQSLNTLCFAAEQETGEGSAQFQALLRRQLPVISRRLQQTLDKLRQPAADERQQVPALLWWDEAQRRFATANVGFVALGVSDAEILPAGLFSSALENLLENAQRKTADGHHLRIEVVLDLTTGPSLQVRDNGQAIPHTVLKGLFRAPVPSEFGLGIGLYQLARQARQQGYEICVLENDDGRVCFALRRAGPGIPPPAGLR